jgi:hypothetical protein
VCSRKVTVGSNPTLSASLRQGYGWQARNNALKKIRLVNQPNYVVRIYTQKFDR